MVLWFRIFKRNLNDLKFKLVFGWLAIYKYIGYIYIHAAIAYLVHLHMTRVIDAELDVLLLTEFR